MASFMPVWISTLVKPRGPTSNKSSAPGRKTAREEKWKKKTSKKDFSRREMVPGKTPLWIPDVWESLQRWALTIKDIMIWMGGKWMENGMTESFQKSISATTDIQESCIYFFLSCKMGWKLLMGLCLTLTLDYLVTLDIRYPRNSSCLRAWSKRLFCGLSMRGKCFINRK